MEPTESELSNIIEELAEGYESTLETLKKIATQNETLKEENTLLKRSLAEKETNERKVYLQKVASSQLTVPQLAPILKKLERVGFIKEGSAANACRDLANDPTAFLALLDAIGSAYDDESFSEGEVTKSASSLETKSTLNGSKQVVDYDGWLTLIKK